MEKQKGNTGVGMETWGRMKVRKKETRMLVWTRGDARKWRVGLGIWRVERTRVERKGNRGRESHEDRVTILGLGSRFTFLHIDNTRRFFGGYQNIIKTA